MSKKVVLAFSGGLDTTYCVKYLSEKLGYTVYSAIVNTGGFTSEELSEIANRAKSLGVAEHETIDTVSEYYQKCIKYLIFGNVLKNNTYPLSVSAERVFQAMAIAKYAKSIGAEAIAHGSTGAGNDQVRFDMIFQTICPDVEIITPIRDNKLSREDEIEFLKANGVQGNWEKALYSINQGLWGTSVGGKETLTSDQYLPESAFPSSVVFNQEMKVSVTFKNGEPVAFNGQEDKPEEIIQKLNEIGSRYAIGRDIHVGDTIIGIKGRVGFEAPGSLILIKAHHTLEKHVLTKNQLMYKDQMSLLYGNLVHEGQFLDPALRDIEAFMESTQQYVSGEVSLILRPYQFIVEGITSEHDLMQSEFGKYGEMNSGWTGNDVRGFAKIFGNQNMIYHKVHGTFDGE